MKSISFSNSKDSVTLDKWLLEHKDEEELRSLFLNMDRTLKYIHEHGYCIEVFYPSEIEILNNQLDHIQFNKLLELSSNSTKRRKMIQEDVYHSALIQIGIYSNSLKFLNPDFIKENFDSFAQFIPNGDVPYYRGVIQRGASVYFCEYALEKRNRDLTELEKQIGEKEGTPLQYKKSNDKQDLTNDEVNDVIYRQINGLSDKAFINILILPTVIILILLISSIIGFIFSFFPL